MMYGCGKSNSAIVAAKLVNKAGRLAAESVERRAGAKGKAAQRNTRRAQDRESVSQALDRIRKVAKVAISRSDSAVIAMASPYCSMERSVSRCRLKDCTPSDWLEEMRRALVVDNWDHRPVYCSRHQQGFQVGRRAARSFSERWPAIPLWFLIITAQGHRRWQEGPPAGCPLTCSVWRLGHRRGDRRSSCLHGRCDCQPGEPSGPRRSVDG